MNKLLLILLVMSVAFVINTPNINAQRGCCSWHDGLDYCGSNGKWICQDGTESPSCTCDNNNFNYNEDDILTFDEYKNTYSYDTEVLENSIEELEKEKEELIEKVDRLENDKQNLYILLTLIIITFIIYIFKIKRTSKSPLST